MIDVAEHSIKTLPLMAEQAQEQPSEDSIFVLTAHQLEDIVTRAIQPLKDEVQDLKAIVTRQGKEIAALEAAEAFKTIGSFQNLWGRMDAIAKGQNSLEDRLETFEFKQDAAQRKKVAGKKTEARMLKLALLLLDRKNNPMTFSEIGKVLELGTRDEKHNTRRQNMTLFGRNLEATPERFIVRPCRTTGGRQVSLTKFYYDHLMKEYVG